MKKGYQGLPRLVTSESKEISGFSGWVTKVTKTLLYINIKKIKKYTYIKKIKKYTYIESFKTLVTGNLGNREVRFERSDYRAKAC